MPDVRHRLPAALLCVNLLVCACAAQSAPTPPSPDSPPPPGPAPETVPLPTAVATPVEDTPRAAPTRRAADPPREADPAGTDVPESDCRLLPASGDGIRTVALSDTVDASHAPIPTNASERLLFRQLYETLVRVDCEGHLRPGLAATWRLDRTGRTWLVTLDEQARFTDGTPVTTADVVSSWGEPGRDRVLGPEARGLVESVVPLSARVIGITLRTTVSTSPRALADVVLAIARREPGVSWPLGTTAFRVTAQRRRSSRQAGLVTIGLSAGSSAAVRAGPANTVRFRVAPGMDIRNQLDEGVDLLVSRDPSVLAYASTLPDFISVPLPWQRTYVLLSPARSPLRQGAPARSALSPAMRQTLAADAVRGEARGAEGPFWWRSTTGCAAVSPVERARSSTNPDGGVGPRVLFRVSDPVAGDLAERLVGLAAFDDANTTDLLETLFPLGAGRLLSAGLDDALFDAELATGRDRGYVVGLERRPLDPCRHRRALVAEAAWLARAGEMLGDAIVPLVDTRRRAVVRRGRAGLTVDGDGVVVLAGVRRARR